MKDRYKIPLKFILILAPVILAIILNVFVYHQPEIQSEYLVSPDPPPIILYGLFSSIGLTVLWVLKDFPSERPGVEW